MPRPCVDLAESPPIASEATHRTVCGFMVNQRHTTHLPRDGTEPAMYIDRETDYDAEGKPSHALASYPSSFRLLDCFCDGAGNTLDRRRKSFHRRADFIDQGSHDVGEKTADDKDKSAEHPRDRRVGGHVGRRHYEVTVIRITARSSVKLPGAAVIVVCS